MAKFLFPSIYLLFVSMSSTDHSVVATVPYNIIACMVSTIGAGDPLSSLLTPYLTARYNAVRAGNGTISTYDDTPSNETMSDSSQCVCSDIYDPVCAINKQSYFNTCLMDCAASPHGNISILHYGNCIPF